MRRCTLCWERYELSAAHFALTKRGFGYLCNSCKSLSNAIRYRRTRIERTGVRPFAVQEQAIIVQALKATFGNAAKAAKLLEIGRATLWRKVKAYKLTGKLSELQCESMKQLRKELLELEEKWHQMTRRAGILRRREARKKAFERKLDKALKDVQREREARHHKEGVRSRLLSKRRGAARGLARRDAPVSP